MNQVYIVMASGGGCWYPPYEQPVKVFADKNRAEQFQQELLSTPDMLAGYEELQQVYVTTYDVE